MGEEEKSHMIWKFSYCWVLIVLALSFDLSLAPSVVGALSPTIGASFQVACFAFCPVEGSGPPNPSCQASTLKQKTLLFDILISILQFIGSRKVQKWLVP